MPSNPFPVNPTSQVVDQAIDGVFSVATQAIELAIFAEVPALNIPVVSTIVRGIVGYISNKIYAQFANFVSFEIIDIQTSNQASDSTKALVALKAAQKSGDVNAINKALDDFQKATVALTVINGSGPHV